MRHQMNERVKKHLEQYCKKNGWEQELDEYVVLEILEDAEQIFREEVNQSRWWNEYRYVVEIDGMLIGYFYAEANRDESMSDLGYEFDFSSVCEMRPIEKTIITYIPVEMNDK